MTDYRIIDREGLIHMLREDYYMYLDQAMKRAEEGLDKEALLGLSYANAVSSCIDNVSAATKHSPSVSEDEYKDIALRGLSGLAEELDI